MKLFTRIRRALAPKPYPVSEFGIGPIPFFIALLHASPPGSRLTFDRSEPESFVHAFRQWSHRSDPESFEADYYTIDAGFIALAEQAAGRDALELDAHLGISSPEGRLLCASWDDFMVVKLAEDMRERIRKDIA